MNPKAAPTNESKLLALLRCLYRRIDRSFLFRKVFVVVMLLCFEIWVMWTSSEIATTSHNMCVGVSPKVGKLCFSCWWEEEHGMEVDAHQMLAPRFLFWAMGSREGRGCPPKVGTCVFSHYMYFDRYPGLQP